MGHRMKRANLQRGGWWHDRCLRLYALVGLGVLVALLGGRAATTLVPAGAMWRYLDDGSNQGTNWIAAAFDDSGWNEGPAQLGYGDNDEATVVSYGPEKTNKYVTTYFRREFVVADPSAFVGVSLEVLRDDGAVVYLNGREILRSNMPGGTISNRTFAASAVGGASESAFFADLVSPTNLAAGTNLLAVEIHQSDASSSDISFDLRLTGVTEPTLTRGPYLQIQTMNSAVIRWRTDFMTDSRVAYGTDAASLTNVVADAAKTNEHIVQIPGLTPETRYFYSIGTSNMVFVGDTNFFLVTAPPIGSVRPVRLWALGDSGTADVNSRAVRDAYLNFPQTRPVDVWLMLGDNAYDAGTDAEYQAAVFDTYPMLLRNTFLWPTIGNHESDQSHTAVTFPYLDIFSLPANAEAGGVASGTPRYYSFDYANVHFVCLDSMTSDRSTNGAMQTWLRTDLQNSTQEWKIAFCHHPPYTKGSHDSDVESDLIDMRTKIIPDLESLGVDLLLNGHSHSYERSYLLNGHYGLSTTLTSAMKVDPGDGRVDGTGAYRKSAAETMDKGTVYVVAGSSGKTSGGPLNHPAIFTAFNQLGSVVIDIVSNRFDASFLSTNQTVLDHFTFIKDRPNAGPPLLEIGISASDSYFLHFSGLSNETYQVEFTEDLITQVWQLFSSVTADNFGNVFFTNLPYASPSRMFRVVRP